MLHMSTAIHLPAPHRMLQTPLLVRAVIVERAEHLVRDARGHRGDVQERVGERRRRQLVVLRERAREDVETL